MTRPQMYLYQLRNHFNIFSRASAFKITRDRNARCRSYLLLSIAVRGPAQREPTATTTTPRHRSAATALGVVRGPDLGERRRAGYYGPFDDAHYVSGSALPFRRR